MTLKPGMLVFIPLTLLIRCSTSWSHFLLSRCELIQPRVIQSGLSILIRCLVPSTRWNTNVAWNKRNPDQGYWLFIANHCADNFRKEMLVFKIQMFCGWIQVLVCNALLSRCSVTCRSKWQLLNGNIANQDEASSLDVAVLLLHDYLKSCNRPDLVGHSTGGCWGYYARRYPETVKSLTLLGVGTYSAVDWKPTIMSIARSWVAKRFSLRWFSPVWLSE